VAQRLEGLVGDARLLVGECAIDEPEGIDGRLLGEAARG